VALTATYDPVLSRIQLAGASLGGSATYAVFDRTVNGGITYTTIRGGTAVTVAAAAAHVDDYEFPVSELITYRVRSYNASDVLQVTFTTTITQALDDPWLKSVPRPYLNQQIFAADASDVEHTSRTGIFPILGRSYPVAVTDVFSQSSFDLTVATLTTGDADDLRYMVTSGDILFLHAPADFPSPVGYFAVGDVRETRQNLPWERRWFTLALTRVAQPGPEVVGTTYTWASALAEYATWTDLIADNATWADLLARVASPSEVIVP
jgi:hypothetical protein